MPKYNEPDDIISQLEEMRKDIARLYTAAGLANSSIEDGSLDAYVDGTQTLQIGTQFDGTNAAAVLTGPTPPTPTAPVLGAAARGIIVTWDGTFVGGALTPMDFSYVAVHVGAPGFDPLLVTPVHVFSSPQGGKVYVPLAAGNYEVALITRTLAGVPSVPSSAGAAVSAPLPSDGTPPASSPTPVVVGSTGAFFLRWAAVTNTDTVTYKVYAGTTAGFTPGPTNIVGVTEATTMSVRMLNDNSAFSYDTNYYFKIIASDQDGDAPASTASPAAQLVKITTEMVAANYVYAGEVFANQIRGGLMTADITVSGSFRTADDGQRTVMDGFGIRQFGPDGVSIIIDLPNDPGQTAKFSGLVNAFGMIVNNGLELRGQKNLFAMGSVTTLATTTGGSSVVPALTPNWDRVDSGMTVYLYNLRGYHREADNANPTFVGNFFGYSRIQHNGFYYTWPQITDANGSNRSNRNVAAGTMIRTSGGQRFVTYAGRVANGGTDTWGFEILDPASMTANNIAPTSLFTNTYGSPSYVTSYVMGRCFSPIGSGTLQNNFALAQFNTLPTPDTIVLRRFACTDTSITQQGSDLTVVSPMPENAPNDGLRGVVYGSSAKMGFPGADQNIWVVFTGSKAYAWNATGTRLPDFDFPVNPGVGVGVAIGSTANNVNGFTRFESTPFYDNDQLISTRYSNIHWAGTDSSVWWVGYTWYDSNATGGVHESDISALSSVTMTKRMQLTITTPDLPDPAGGQGTPRLADDVNSFRVYMQRQGTKPTRTQLWQQTTQPADLDTTVTISTMPDWSGTSNPPSSTTFPAQAPAVIQSSGIGADGLPRIKLTGDGYAHFEALDVSGTGATSFTGKAFEQLYYGIRGQALLSGGGQISVSASYEVTWSQRFITISMGRGSNTATSGVFNISPPAVGTVIPGYGGAANATVTSSGIPLAATWTALYYELPFGSASTSLDANFRLVHYTSSFVVPNNWILICLRNGDSNQVQFPNGISIVADAEYFPSTDWAAGGMTLVNSWANFGAPYAAARYKRDNTGRVWFKGMIKSGAAGSTFTTLPTGFRPGSDKSFIVQSSNGFARIIVYSTGACEVNSFVSGGANTSVSLDQVSYEVNQ